MMGSAVKQLGRREREAKGTSMPLRTPSMSERNGFRKRNMSASGQSRRFRDVGRESALAPYWSDRNEGWLKIKCSQPAKFPVVGFAAPQARWQGTELRGEGRHNWWYIQTLYQARERREKHFS
jgi:hypothetical protein